MELNAIKSKGNWGEMAADLNANFAAVTAELEKLKATNVKFKGYFTSERFRTIHPCSWPIMPGRNLSIAGQPNIMFPSSILLRELAGVTSTVWNAPLPKFRRNLEISD